MSQPFLRLYLFYTVQIVYNRSHADGNEVNFHPMVFISKSPNSHDYEHKRSYFNNQFH